MKNGKMPNIIIFLIIAVIIMVMVYLGFRINEKIDERRNAAAGNWFTNLFKSTN
jgi:predicted negative regulator of RcsB-dependent stress response